MHRMHRRELFVSGVMRMDTLEILLNGKPCGELVTERNGLYISYRAVCRLGQGIGPVRLFAVGETGELQLGVMQPEDGCFVLRRNLTARESQAVGTLLRGELRQFMPVDGCWRPVGATETVFRERALQMRLQELNGNMICRSGEQWFLALPFSTDGPFPLVDLFCFAHVRWMWQREYAVFCFGPGDRPTFF